MENYTSNNQQQPNNNANDNQLGMATNTYLMLMHLSQFAGYIVPFLGFVAPIIMWAINKDKNEEVDKHGKNILNFIISWVIYAAVSFLLVFVIIGIPLLVLLGALQVVFIIIATIKANSNEYWKYPLTIPFFSAN